MKLRTLVGFGAMLLLAACSNDPSDSRLQDASVDRMAGYDGEISVNISMAGGVSTRTVNEWEDGNDAFYGGYVFPRTKFTTTDAVGILHVVKRDGNYEVTNYKAVTTDGGANWSVQDTEGNTVPLRYYGQFENHYYAYSPYVEGGLTASAYTLSVLDSADPSAYNFFLPTVQAKANANNDQSTDAGFIACDLLGAKGTCTADLENKTAELTISLDHLLALDIVKLKKSNAEVTLYGCYDTWVAPDKTIWRMKQRLEPVVTEAFAGEVTPKTDNIMDKWYLRQDADNLFYMRLVMPNEGKTKFGHADLAKNGGWLIDIPGIPSGQYVVLGVKYFRYFRKKGFTPAETNAAGQAWQEEWATYFQDEMPYTWTYEDILFADSNESYDYDAVLSIGDKLMDSGNISKSNNGVGTVVGTVKWIAYAPQPWLSMPSVYNFDKWLEDQIYFFDEYVDDPTLFADNGYRAKGCVVVDNTKKHLSVDYAGYGFSSLDEFWSTDICNHFLAFSNSTVNYKSSPSEIKHNDEIFSVALPKNIYDTMGLFTVSGMFNQYLYGSIPSSWAFMSNDWYLNKDNISGIRSNMPANQAGGPVQQVGGVSWMVPTVAEYYIGHYSETTTEDYLTCNYLPVSDGKEGVVTVQEKYTFSEDAAGKYVYYGDGYTMNFPKRINGLFKSYDCMPIASKEIHLTGDRYVMEDNLYIHNPSDKSLSVIAPPTRYIPCIAF